MPLEPETDFQTEGTQFETESAPRALLEATRALLWVSSKADARNVARDLVASLGGTAVPAEEDRSDTLPIDLSFGDGQPLVPCAPSGSVAMTLLERYLPSFVNDARRAVEVNSKIGRFSIDASIDSLTGLANRRMTDRALGRLARGDTVIMCDLDFFKKINDRFGHHAGDEVLRAFGEAIRASVRGRDFVGRYGGEEFVFILAHAEDPEAFLQRLKTVWVASRPYEVSFSAGIAVVESDPSLALPAADRALYEAKSAGRDRWVQAIEDTPASPEMAVSSAAEVSETAFVAFSQLFVPDAGIEEVQRAFRDRLGAVDHWPGFIELQVWSDTSDQTKFVMVSWWTSEDSFRDYMHSSDHRLSHSRIPGGDFRPRAREFRRFTVVAT